MQTQTSLDTSVMLI